MESRKGLIVMAACLLALVSAKSTIDAPPTITELLPADLQRPQTFLQFVNTSSNLKNTLRCSAENADDIIWSYSKDGDNFGGSWPAKMVRNPLDTVGSIVYVEVTATDSDKPEELDGYYKCEATNSQGARGYKSVVPPFRLAYASIPATRDPPTSIEGTLHQPVRLPCKSDDVTISPSDLFQLNITRFSWKIFSFTGTGRSIDATGDRITIDPITGDLYFAYLKASDQLLPGDKFDEYSCSVTYSDVPYPIHLGRRYLRVAANTDRSNPVAIQYPKSEREKKVTCVEKQLCYLRCIFSGGGEGTAEIGRPVITQPAGASVATTETPSGVSFVGIGDAQGTWKCNIGSVSVNIEVTILQYPTIMPLETKYVEAGKPVEYFCNTRYAATTEFYINGELLTSSRDNIVYTPGSTLVKVSNTRPDNTANIVCMSTNEAATVFKSANLIVYTPTAFEQYPDPKVGYLIEGNSTQLRFSFNCSAQFDSKVTQADIEWYTNRTGAVEKLLGSDAQGVESISEGILASNQISSTLSLLLNTDSEKFLGTSDWWCKIVYNIPGSVPFEKVGARTPFRIAAKSDRIVTPVKAIPWWLFGVAGALLFFILLIVLIICCVKQNKGEAYYVDEKERKDGRDPEEELNHYAFADYQRPDQNPIKGSRASMNFSDRPMDSDNGSMDEYGDIDTGRFNEDGSFIGQYGQKRNQADV